jgi:hypothetical protein
MERTFAEVKKQTESAETSANASKSAAETSALTMRLDQRAWVIVKYPTIPLTIGQPIAVPLTLENIGKTLAKNISAVFAIYVTKRGETPDFVCAHGHSYYSFGPTGYFPPNIPDTERWFALSRKDSRTITLTKDMDDAIRDGKLAITIHGKIDYEDIFGTPHWVTFCQQGEANTEKTRTGGNDQCSAYNQADNNQTPDDDPSLIVP